MEVQLKKGLVEALVLNILKNGDAYGYILISEVKAVMDISESTLYPVLRRLEAQGHLTIYSMEHNGRLRKYYHLTKSGHERLDQYRLNLLDVKQVIDFIFS